MGKLTIELPDDVIETVRQQADGNIDKFVQGAVQYVLDHGATDELETDGEKAELIRLLDDGLKSGPGVSLTDELVEEWMAIARGESEPGAK